MAEPATSESSPDTDRDFDPSADMMVHDFDDEHTLDEEEALSGGESVGNELDSLQKESEMPMEELLAMYGYGASSAGGDSNPPSASETQDTRSSSEEEILSNQDLTLDKDEIARDLLNDHDEADRETTVNDLLDSVHMPSQTVRLLRSSSQPGSSDDDSEDADYEPEKDEDWKKTIQVGSSYQAVVPEGLAPYGDAPAYENEDRLLWDPLKLEDAEVEKYLCEVQQQNQQAAQGVQAIPTGAHVRDDEQALFMLLQCAHNAEEALRRRKMQAVPATDPMSLWSEEECRNFESGLRHYGKDFYLVQQNKVRTRSVGELVQFYYLWKKTDRHDVFANKNRLEKKKYALHPGITDYMDRFLDEQENPTSSQRERSSSPNIHSLLYGDPKRHGAHSELRVSEDIIEMVQKVVGDAAPGEFPGDMKLNSEALHASIPLQPLMSSLNMLQQHGAGGEGADYAMCPEASCTNCHADTTTTSTSGIKRPSSSGDPGTPTKMLRTESQGRSGEGQPVTTSTTVSPPSRPSSAPSPKTSKPASSVANPSCKKSEAPCPSTINSHCSAKPHSPIDKVKSPSKTQELCEHHQDKVTQASSESRKASGIVSVSTVSSDIADTPASFSSLGKDTSSSVPVAEPIA